MHCLLDYEVENMGCMELTGTLVSRLMSLAHECVSGLFVCNGLRLQQEQVRCTKNAVLS